MCGIAGVIDPETWPDLKTLVKMAEPLVKRGPDDSGTFLRNHIGLIHRRLSIIDLRGGHQPMYNEDRSLVIIFNGEIYDYQLFRRELLRKGHRFQTNCDTEVLLHLYEDMGLDMFSILNGMFAMAVYNIRSGELVLARDRFGKKPLFYAQSGDRFAFASGPAAISWLPWVDAGVDCSAVHDYLEFQYVPTPRSIYKGIKKIPPGSYAVWKKNSLDIRRCYQPRITADYPLDYHAAKLEVQQKLKRAVARRLVADVPVGMFLSGGMDSSLICALASHLMDRPPLTFSIGFPEEKYDERKFGELVARHLGADHHFLEVNPEDFDHLRQVVSAFEEPFADASMLPTSLLARFTRGEVTVSLSGDGADEFFGGYYRYRIMYLYRWLRAFPIGLRRMVCRSLLPVLPAKSEERTFWGRIRRMVEITDVDGLDRYLRLISRCPEPLKSSLYGDRMREESGMAPSINVMHALMNNGRLSGSVNEIMELDIRSYLNDDILVKVDRASMAYGLEVRSPFMDVEVAELGMSLPYSWKQKGMRRKRILQDAFSELLPPEIFSRAKMGFGVPVARWLRNEWQKPVRETLLHGRLVGDQFFDGKRIEWLLDQHDREQADFSYALFALLVLELWTQSVCKIA